MDKTDSHFSSNKYEKRIILKTETSPLLSFHSRGTPYSRAPLSLRASLDKCSSHDSEERLFSRVAKAPLATLEIFEPFISASLVVPYIYIEERNPVENEEGPRIFFSTVLLGAPP